MDVFQGTASTRTGASLIAWASFFFLLTVTCQNSFVPQFPLLRCHLNVAMPCMEEQGFAGCGQLGWGVPSCFPPSSSSLLLPSVPALLQSPISAP